MSHKSPERPNLRLVVDNTKDPTESFENTLKEEIEAAQSKVDALQPFAGMKASINNAEKSLEDVRKFLEEHSQYTKSQRKSREAQEKRNEALRRVSEVNNHITTILQLMSQKSDS